MERQKFDLRDIYQRAFGRVGLPFPAGLRPPGLDDLLPVNAVNTFAKGFQKRPEEQRVAAPYGDFDRKGRLMGSVYFMPVRLDGFQLWNEPTIEISGEVNIVETQVAGSKRRGTVKEIVSMGDYRIRLQGLIINEQSEYDYPADGVRKFREIVEKSSLTGLSIAIDCELTTLFEISQCVVESFDLPALEGFPSVQPYSISLRHDEPFEYELQSPVNRLN